MAFTATILGGARDGEIYTCDYRVLRLPELRRRNFLTAEFAADRLPAENVDDYGVVEYRFELDDDARGWWVSDDVRPAVPGLA